MDTFLIIGSIIFGIVVWVIYHKLFDVTYFGGKAFMTELLVCLCIGGVITTLMIEYWVIVAIILAILIVFACFKGQKTK